MYSCYLFVHHVFLWVLVFDSYIDTNCYIEIPLTYTIVMTSRICSVKKGALFAEGIICTWSCNCWVFVM